VLQGPKLISGPEVSLDDRVIANVDSMRGAELVNRKQFYTTTCGVIYPAMCITAITSIGTAPWAVNLPSYD